MQLLKKEKLYAKFSKCEFWLRKVQFLGHVINGNEIHVVLSKIETRFMIGKALELRMRGSFVLRIDRNMEFRISDLDGYKLWLCAVLALLVGRKEKVFDVSSIKNRILAAQKEAVDEFTILQKGLDEMIEQRSDGEKPFIMDEAHESKYSVHPGANKMYYDLRDRPSGLLQQPEISVWKWEGIAIDFVTKFPRTGSSMTNMGSLWFDCLSLLFLPLCCEDFKMDKVARLYLNEIVADMRLCRISIISDRHDSRFSSRFWQSMQEAIWDSFYDLSTLITSDRWSVEVLFRTLETCLEPGSWDFSREVRNCRSLIMWAEVVEGQLIGPGKKGKLAPRFVGPFEIMKKVGPVAYRLDLPEELNGVHDTFHVSNLMKCLADLTLQVPLDEIRVDAKLNFMEEPVKILEIEFKKLKRSRIAIVKVR
ncbi:hypothetical protein Tco_1475369 [Tanacetum coccineum]